MYSRTEVVSLNEPVPAGGVTAEGKDAMKVAPWHTKVPTEHPVHHDETRCTLGDNIESYNRVPGTGGHPKCHLCKSISG